MIRFRPFLILVLLITTNLFVSCSDDDAAPKGEFEHGFFVVNEGNFLDADGTISHVSVSGDVTNDLFGSANDGRALGDVVQSMSINSDFGYIIVNNSNKVEVVNINTFKSSHTIEGLKLPRYFTALNGKGYVTEWVNFSDRGRVSVINLQTHDVETTITTDFGAENIIAANGKLYVSNNFTNTVSVIDPTNNTVVKTIETGEAPGAIVLDNQNSLWVICGGGYDANFDPLNNGKLVQINTTSNEVVKTLELKMNVTAKLAINKAKNKLFLYKGKSVYAISTADTEVSADDIFVTENAASGIYGLGVDPATDNVYVADAKAFAGSGAVYVYTSSAQPAATYAVGRGPNGFAFR